MIEHLGFNDGWNNKGKRFIPDAELQKKYDQAYESGENYRGLQELSETLHEWGHALFKWIVHKSSFLFPAASLLFLLFLTGNFNFGDQHSIQIVAELILCGVLCFAGYAGYMFWRGWSYGQVLVNPKYKFAFLGIKLYATGSAGLLILVLYFYIIKAIVRADWVSYLTSFIVVFSAMKFAYVYHWQKGRELDWFDTKFYRRGLVAYLAKRNAFHLQDTQVARPNPEFRVSNYATSLCIAVLYLFISYLGTKALLMLHEFREKAEVVAVIRIVSLRHSTEVLSEPAPLLGKKRHSKFLASLYMYVPYDSLREELKNSEVRNGYTYIPFRNLNWFNFASQEVIDKYKGGWILINSIEPESIPVEVYQKVRPDLTNRYPTRKD